MRLLKDRMYRQVYMGKEGEEGNNKGEGDKDEKAKKGKADLSSPTVVKGSWVLT